jgi:curved DNA-binding protein CbpA
VIDYYRLLQVRRDASAEVIAAAYKRLMRDAHPDHGGDAEHAKRLNAAYETLARPESRRAYDLTLPPEAPGAAPVPNLAFRVGVGLGRQLARLQRAWNDASA